MTMGISKGKVVVLQKIGTMLFAIQKGKYINEDLLGGA
jgi:hypothetical protein